MYFALSREIVVIRVYDRQQAWGLWGDGNSKGTEQHCLRHKGNRFVGCACAVFVVTRVFEWCISEQHWCRWRVGPRGGYRGKSNARVSARDM